MADLETLAESLSSLTVMDAASLVKILEEKWGVVLPIYIAALHQVQPGLRKSSRRR